MKKKKSQKKLVSKILKASNIINQYSRRGGANYMVVSGKTAELFEEIKKEADERAMILEREKTIKKLLGDS
tara:strand:- start:57185 stop:57397 length:213 start_codon:yes stop_codon:yes gene_type:complete